MITNREPYLRIAEKFGLNANTVTAHGKKHVLPFAESIELQANAAVLARVMAYRDEVNLPLPEKAKHIENRLWADYDIAENIPERMAVMREIQKQQVEQAKLAGAYIKDAPNPADAQQQVKDYLAECAKQGIPDEIARAKVTKLWPEAKQQVH